MAVIQVVRSVTAVLAVAVVLAGCTAGPGDVAELQGTPTSTLAEPDRAPGPELEPDAEPEVEPDEWTGWFDPDVTDAYEYPITPEDEEWAEYGTVELWAMLEVPAETLEQMSTSGLLITAMTHPHLFSMLAWDSPPMAAEVFLTPDGYGALAVLLDRPDGPGTLLDYYRRPEAWVGAAELQWSYANLLHVLLGLDPVVGPLGQDGRTAMVAAMVEADEPPNSPLVQSARWAVMRALQIDSPAFAEAVAADEDLVAWLDPERGLNPGWSPVWEASAPVFVDEVAAVYGVHVGDTLGFAG